ncbi:hypothetical protein AKO1_008063 [Acrasis kona]|uniref:Uncharacterized protein n=1 Tax=Acrasis kona TaxID=1008807 RepID=A0AAW2YQX2_9EUKA
MPSQTSEQTHSFESYDPSSKKFHHDKTSKVIKKKRSPKKPATKDVISGESVLKASQESTQTTVNKNDENVSEMIRKWKYQPGEKDGEELLCFTREELQSCLQSVLEVSSGHRISDMILHIRQKMVGGRASRACKNYPLGKLSEEDFKRWCDVFPEDVKIAATTMSRPRRELFGKSAPDPAVTITLNNAEYLSQVPNASKNWWHFYWDEETTGVKRYFKVRKTVFRYNIALRFLYVDFSYNVFQPSVCDNNDIFSIKWVTV